jgi:hypothetical protein
VPPCRPESSTDGQAVFAAVTATRVCRYFYRIINFDAAFAARSLVRMVQSRRAGMAER